MAKTIKELKNKFRMVIVAKMHEATAKNTTELEPELSVAFRAAVDSIKTDLADDKDNKITDELLTSFMELIEKKLEDIKDYPLTKSSVIKLHNINEDIKLLNSLL